MTTSRVVVVMVLGALLSCRGDGCRSTVPLEPIPTLETCDFADALRERQFVTSTASLGRVVDGGFVPFSGGEEVEIAPVPRDLFQTWYALVAVAVTASEGEVGSSFCGNVEALSWTSNPADEAVPDGFVFKRLGDAWVARQVPIELAPQDNSSRYFQPKNPAETFLEGGGVIFGGFSNVFDARPVRVKVKPVNHEGFLSDATSFPGETPAGGGAGGGGGGVVMPASFSLELRTSMPALRRGEAANVEVVVTGPRDGQPVDFTVQGLPAGVTLTLPTISPAAPGPEVTTSGRLLVDSAAPLGAFTLDVTATAGANTAKASAALQVMAAPDAKVVSLSASPATLQLEPGATGELLVRVVPFGGLAGVLSLKALTGPELEVSVTPETVMLTGPVDVQVKVKLLRASAPGVSLPLQLVGALGRTRWPVTQALRVVTLAPSTPSPYVVSLVRERRFVAAGSFTDWQLDVGTHVAPGTSAPATTLGPLSAPPGCSAQQVAVGVRFTCDATFTGAAGVPVTASSTAGTAGTTLRLVSGGGATLVPEPQSLLFDSHRPTLAPNADGGVALAFLSSLGPQQLTVNAAGVAGSLTPGFGEQFGVVRAGPGFSTFRRSSNGPVSVGNRSSVGSSTLGPLAVAVDTNQAAWVATGESSSGAVRLAAYSNAAGAPSWTTRDQGLADAGTPTDLALAASGGTVVLASVETPLGALSDAQGEVVVRLWTGTTWRTLAGVPAPQAVPLPFEAQGQRREQVLGVALDNLLRPHLAFIGVDEQVHLLRWSGAAWETLSGATVPAGTIPLSLSLDASPTGAIALGWTWGSHALVAQSGTRVQPRHLATSGASWALLTAQGLGAPAPLGLDRDEGTFEHVTVGFDPQNNLVAAWVEDGRVIFRRLP